MYSSTASVFIVLNSSFVILPVKQRILKLCKNLAMPGLHKKTITMIAKILRNSSTMSVKFKKLLKVECKDVIANTSLDLWP